MLSSWWGPNETACYVTGWRTPLAYSVSQCVHKCRPRVVTKPLKFDTVSDIIITIFYFKCCMRQMEIPGTHTHTHCICCINENNNTQLYHLSNKHPVLTWMEQCACRRPCGLQVTVIKKNLHLDNQKHMRCWKTFFFPPLYLHCCALHPFYLLLSFFVDDQTGGQPQGHSSITSLALGVGGRMDGGMDRGGAVP